MSVIRGLRISSIQLICFLLIAGLGAFIYQEWIASYSSVDLRMSSFELLAKFEIGIIFLSSLLLIRSLNRERKAESQRRNFSSLLQNSGDFISITNLNRQFQYLNPAGRKMLGLDEHFPLERAITENIYAPEDNEKAKTEIIPSILAKGYWTGEMRFRHVTTKELIPVMMNAFALRDAVTNEIVGIANVSRDLRDRKKLERQLDRFFEVSLDMLGIANTDGYFLRLNPAFSEILGYTEAELCSRPAVEFVHPDDIQCTIDQIQKQASGSSVLSFENRYRTKSGDYRWFSWKSSPDGDLTYGAARDITEEKEQQALMKKLSQDAIAASLAKSEFLANMSHEIRTPINGVIGMTTLLLDGNLGTEQKEFAENIMSSAESLLTVINDILDFSKIEAGKLEVEKVDFSLEDLVDETAKATAWAVRNKSIPFLVNCDRGARHLFRGDPGRIRQVLTNLLTNAIKFTHTGSINFDVTSIKSTENSTQFRFAIKDSGIGLSEDVQKKLFLAFSQADASTTRKFGGTGLGLSICKRLVELMDGEIGVDSVEGQGSTFWFNLTLEHSTELSFKPKPNSKVAKTQFPNAQILIAEDNIVNQKILLAMLDKIGLKAQAVANGNEVLSILREKSFDLILMDCQMPELDGYSTTIKIRESQSLSQVNIPIIAMTANALKGDKEKCLDSGMNDYASKPIGMIALAEIIEKWLTLSASDKKSAS